MMLKRIFGVVQKNILLVCLTGAVIVAGGALMHVSQRVHETQKAVKSASRQIIEEGWAIRALKAEWAYLSRPGRLEELSVALARLQSDETAPAAQPVVAPASYLSDTPQQALYIPAVLPLRKPATQIIHKAAHKKTGQKKAEGDFSSLLQRIGGAP